MHGETYSRRKLTKEKGIANYRSPEAGGGECVWNISEQIQSTTGHHGAMTKGCQGHCFYMCGVAQHAEDTAVPGRQGTNPSK